MTEEAFVRQLYVMRDFLYDHPDYATSGTLTGKAITEISGMALGFLANEWGKGSTIHSLLWNAAAELACGRPLEAGDRIEQVIALLLIKQKER